jgi:fatty-acyl-CoA synthase
MIVSGGENVFPAEVEELLSSHEAIEEAAAIGVDDEKFGQRLMAFVVLRDGAELSEDEIKDYVSQNLARYKAPRAVVFVDELPRNPTGKVLKRELLEQAEDREQKADEPEQKADEPEQKADEPEQKADEPEQKADEPEQEADEAEQEAEPAEQEAGQAG